MPTWIDGQAESEDLTVVPVFAQSTLSGASNLSTSSATYSEVDASLRVTVDVPATGMVRLDLSAVAYMDGTNDGYFAVSPDGGTTWHQIIANAWSAAATYEALAGSLVLTGLPVGAVTFQVGWKAGGTIHIPANSRSASALGTVLSVLTLPFGQGEQGIPGSIWRNGTGAPSNGLGNNGDYYLDDAAGNVYNKSGGVYTIVANLSLGINLQYDFAVDGGATGTITLRGNAIPANFVVTKAWVDCKTPFSGAGASTAFSTGQAAGDIQATTAITSSSNLGFAAAEASVALAIKTTASRAPTLVISGAVLTAGKFVLHIDGWQSTP